MAFTYGFYNSLNDDRLYNATQVSEIFDGIIRDGVFSSIDEIFATVPGEGLQVIVKTGRAWFNHTWNKNDSAYPLNIDPAHVTLSRRDAVVLEVNEDVTARRNRLLIVKGVAATTPAKPTLTNTLKIHQHVLAYVTIPPAATAITAGMIDIRVGTSDCPFVTGPLQTANIDDLFQQWEYNFNAWFENVQLTLTENVVTNLQYQIDHSVKVADRATIAEAKSPAITDKWISPQTLNSRIANMDFTDQYVWLFYPSTTTTYTETKTNTANTVDTSLPCNYASGEQVTPGVSRLVTETWTATGGIPTAIGRTINPSTGAVTVTGATYRYPKITKTSYYVWATAVVPGTQQVVSGWSLVGGTTIIEPPSLSGLYWLPSGTTDQLASAGAVYYGGGLAFKSATTVSMTLTTAAGQVCIVSSVSSSAGVQVLYADTSNAYPSTGQYRSLGKFSQLPTHITTMTTGSYSGNSSAYPSSQNINLGFQPRAVFVARTRFHSEYFGASFAFTIFGFDLINSSGYGTSLSLTPTGFTVYNGTTSGNATSPSLNVAGTTYVYMAFR